ncbi:succinate dehydrogenase [bacterium]|nr:MAG: succinate dehydrogenase [bacterium]
MALPAPAAHDRFGQTRRIDGWWINPSAFAATFLVFVVYSSWAAFQPREFAHFAPYTSPFFSPDLTRIIPGFKWSPALLIMWIPAGFRFTCYYGRKAYYRSLVFSPHACAVGKGDRNYKGETGLLIVNNLHRYFLYIVIVLVVFHWIHFFDAFDFNGKFGMGLGSLVVALDTITLTLYVMSCHSLRHLIGGNVDCYHCACAGKPRHNVWKAVSFLNQYHNAFFWISLAAVGFADIYVRMCAMGIWKDVRFF